MRQDGLHIPADVNTTTHGVIYKRIFDLVEMTIGMSNKTWFPPLISQPIHFTSNSTDIDA